MFLAFSSSASTMLSFTNDSYLFLIILRVCVSGVMKEQMVSVYFCDFGDVSVLPLDKLQPLKSQFLELPYQAIKARLAGM